MTDVELASMMLRLAGELSVATITWMAGEKTVGSYIVPRIPAAAEAGRASIEGSQSLLRHLIGKV